MKISRLFVPLLVLAVAGSAGAQAPRAFPAAVAPYVSVSSPVVAITGVRLIDGTGSAPRTAQTIIFREGRITAIGADGATTVPSGAATINGAGKTLIPGLVGTHNHLYYASGPQPDGIFQVREQWISFPRLYLAAGVTTMRTTGSVEPYTDLNLRRLIDEGKLAGPSLDVTAPYLTGPNATFIQMAHLRDALEARRTVRYWAQMGATSFKLYTDIATPVARAIIEEAHGLHLQVTGHLCSIGFGDAAKLGIDALEHGIFVDTEFDPEKKDDVCPPTPEFRKALLALDIDGPQMRALIADLVKRHVAISSTLAIFETFGARPLSERTLAMLAPEVRTDVETVKKRLVAGPAAPDYEALLRKEMAFERAFVRAGGLLTTGPDPTGAGGVIAGFGDQRGIELLVEAGFTPLEALRIATRNGAQLLGRLHDVGTLEVGKRADAVLLGGDPSTRIADVENVETVFKAGIGYDSAKMIASVKGTVGRR